MSAIKTNVTKDWRRAKLADLLTIIRGVSYKKEDATSEPAEDRVPILRATNIQDGLVFENFVYVPYKYVSEDQFLRPGDIVIAASSGSRHIVGKAAQLTNEWHGSFGTFCFGLRPKSGVNPRYLAWFLQTSEYRHQVSELSAGVNINNLRANHIEEIPIPVAPVNEQRRIVAEIEKQFTRLEAGVTALRRVQANLKRYRAAVLKAACEGRLVPSDSAAWKHLKVSEIGEAVTGNTPPTSDKENLGDKLPFFKPTDLDAGYNVRDARQYLSAKGAEYARVLPAGAVLVTCIGATIGKTGFARVDCATNQQINALVVNPKIAIPQWAFWLLSSPIGQQQIKSKASATTLPILNKSKFEALEFSLPTLAEQTRIVAEVERRLSVVEGLEVAVSASLQRAVRFRHSVLQKAFAGELT